MLSAVTLWLLYHQISLRHTDQYRRPVTERLLEVTAVKTGLKAGLLLQLHAAAHLTPRTSLLEMLKLQATDMTLYLPTGSGCLQ